MSFDREESAECLWNDIRRKLKSRVESSLMHLELTKPLHMMIKFAQAYHKRFSSFLPFNSFLNGYCIVH